MVVCTFSFVYLLEIFFSLVSYHEAYIKHRIVMVVYFKMITILFLLLLHFMLLVSQFRAFNVPTSAGSSKKQESSRKNSYFCFIDYAKAFDYVDHNKLWKILKELGIPDHLTCLLRNLYAGQEATVRTGHGTTDWFRI